jgi:hypothetical protein
MPHSLLLNTYCPCSSGEGKTPTLNKVKPKTPTVYWEMVTGRFLLLDQMEYGESSWLWENYYYYYYY